MIKGPGVMEIMIDSYVFIVFHEPLCDKTNDLIRLCVQRRLRSGSAPVVILHTSFQCLGTPVERYSGCVSFIAFGSP